MLGLRLRRFGAAGGFFVVDLKGSLYLNSMEEGEGDVGAGDVGMRGEITATRSAVRALGLIIIRGEQGRAGISGIKEEGQPRFAGRGDDGGLMVCVASMVILFILLNNLITHYFNRFCI